MHIKLQENLLNKQVENLGNIFKNQTNVLQESHVTEYKNWKSKKTDIRRQIKELNQDA